MIIEKKNTDLLVAGDQVINKKATISAEEMAKLQYILTEGLYKDPITAVIAEWTNNGIDSVRQAKKDPIHNPVIVEIATNHLNQSIFSVEDKGEGLDNRDFEDICMNYLKSTKEQNVEAIGCYGIGMKSFLALERSATFTCRKNGVERKYLVYKGEEFVNYTLISENKTTEQNGVRAELTIKDRDEKWSFYNKAKQKLAYYDTAVLIYDGKIAENYITRTDLFQWSTLNSDWDMHLCLKDVYYTIDWKSLGIKAIPIPMALRFELTDGITPTPSRESYITNDKTKKLILDKIKQVSEWMCTRYNDTMKEFTTFYEGYEYFGTPTYIIKLSNSAGNETAFTINNLVGYSSIQLINPKVKGITYINPERMKSYRDHIFYEWDVVGWYSGTSFKTKNIYTSIPSHLFNARMKPIIVGPIFAGHVKMYLNEKYKDNTLYIRKNTAVRKLKSTDSMNYDTWHHILQLDRVPKADHQSHIKEWQEITKTLTDMFIDETQIESDKAFIDWVEKRKAKQKADRLAGIVKGEYKGLGKKDGDITMAYARPSEIGQTMVFEKKAYKVSDMQYPHFKTVLLKETDDLEMAKDIARIFVGDHVRFAVVGPRELLKLPTSPQFIDMDKFTSVTCKPFGRLASAIVYREIVKDFDKIAGVKSGIFKKCLTSVMDDRNTLEKYSQNYLANAGSRKVEGYIVTTAEKQNLFDKTLWDVYLRVKESIKRFEFIAMMAEPYSWDAHQQQRYVKFIREQLLFRKKYFKDVDDTILKELNK